MAGLAARFALAARATRSRLELCPRGLLAARALPLQLGLCPRGLLAAWALPSRLACGLSFSQLVLPAPGSLFALAARATCSGLGFVAIRRCREGSEEDGR